MPASRSARAMIFAPRSWPSRPGLATTTRIFLVLEAAAMPPILWLARHPELHLHVRWWIEQTIVYVPARRRVLLNVPDLLSDERNFTGPLVTATLCSCLPVQRHVTLVPFLTVTVGGEPLRTK